MKNKEVIFKTPTLLLKIIFGYSFLFLMGNLFLNYTGRYPFYTRIIPPIALLYIFVLVMHFAGIRRISIKRYFREIVQSLEAGYFILLVLFFYYLIVRRDINLGVWDHLLDMDLTYQIMMLLFSTPFVVILFFIERYLLGKKTEK